MNHLNSPDRYPGMIVSKRTADRIAHIRKHHPWVDVVAVILILHILYFGGIFLGLFLRGL